MLWSTALTSLVLAIIALFAGGNLPSQIGNSPSASCSPTVIEGMSAYDVWKALGNTGSEKDFLNSLIGKSGTDGFSGPSGDDGKSAYQLWLEAGHTGTEQDFLNSLVGDSGVAGAAGFGAYELWLSLGNSGTEQDFMDSLAGDHGHIGISGSTGATGASGEPGPSGPAGPAGPSGPAGSPGVCYIGDTGPKGEAGPIGLTGASAYDIWLANLASPTPSATSVSDFLFSLKGDKGDKGDPGADGSTGFGSFGSFWDIESQGYGNSVSTEPGIAYPMYFGLSDAANNGVAIVAGDGDASDHASYITFDNPGIYNISFSAQLLHSGGSSSTVSIWLRKNGLNVPETNTDITLANNNGKAVAAWNFFVAVECPTVDSVTTCDNYQLMWSYSGTDTKILYQDPSTSPDRPAIPSIILTVNQVGN